jgi:hypothetical protein
VDGRGYHNPGAPEGLFMGVALVDNVTPDMKIYQATSASLARATSARGARRGL